MTISSFALQYRNVNFQAINSSTLDLFITEGAPLAASVAGRALTDEQVALLKAQGRIVVGYVDVAVTDDKRYYWQADGKTWTANGTDTTAPTADAPSYLQGAVLFDFDKATDGPTKGDDALIVRFTDPLWQSIVIAQAVELVRRGYSGIFLDDVGAYFQFANSIEDSVPNRKLYATEMAELIGRIGAAVRAVDASAFIIANADPFFINNQLDNPRGNAARAIYLETVDAHLFENKDATDLDATLASFGDEQLLFLESISHPGYTQDQARMLGALYVAPADYASLGTFAFSATDSSETLTGGDGPNQLSGLGGNDTIKGNGGNDTLSGGAGTDTAIYTATRAATTITRGTNGSLIVTSIADGTDTVSGVELFQFADGTFSFAFADPGGTRVNNFTVNAGGWSSQDRFPRHVADVNGDGFADIVGFGQAGTLVAFGSAGGTFSGAATAIADFGQAQGWSADNTFHRELADVNKDGRADIVGFGIGGVLVSLAQANGTFAAPGLGSSNFNPANGWSSQDSFTRTLADVNGDGFTDIVGFGIAGTFVALGNGNGSFGNANFALDNFGRNQGWSSDNIFHREVGDVNGDGRADVVGFGIAGTLVALGQTNGTFAPATLALGNFGTNQGWSTQDAFTRDLGDVNGDGRADVVGFGIAGTFVAYGQTNGTFSGASFDVPNFGNNQGWTSDNILHRELADLNGDKRADIVGFGFNGVFASTAFEGLAI